MKFPQTRGPVIGNGHFHDDLDALVTFRDSSLFSADMEARWDSIAAELEGRRILIIGGAGSIGAATTKLLFDFHPRAVHIIDQNENELTELVRDLRARPQGLPTLDFRALPLDCGSPVVQRFLGEADPYDIVLNFAALKHVRSEKDVYSALQMIDTNVVRHMRFKTWLAEYGHARTYFAVSTDKAADPTSLMGASKRLMEDLIFSVGRREGDRVTSARFANVAFSNGSLLQGFQRRLSRCQPLALPRGARRYFISQGEAAEICLLACLVCPDGHIAFPRMDAQAHLQSLEAIAVRLLNYFGLTPIFYEDDVAARCETEALAKQGRWPVLLTPLDTSGEKLYEEFLGGCETATEIGLKALLAITRFPDGDAGLELLQQLDQMVNDPDVLVGKTTIVETISRSLPCFQHIETEKNLDQRL